MFWSRQFSKLQEGLSINFVRKKHLNLEFERKDWKPVVGLEIHAQIKTCSKLFSGASTAFGCQVNANVSLFDAAIPGTLPVLNRKCVELGITTALALSCDINEISTFDRKHYFYADLPAGYQITQQRAPLARNGTLKFPIFNPAKHKAPYNGASKILQLQLEQDSGKSLHDDYSQRSLIDLNRAGVPLMEIVFAPDLSNGEEAAALVKELILILTRIGTCSCKMEEGALRVDANVSLHQPGEKFGVRTEVKNIGSVRGVANAIDFEIQRQLEVLSSGGEIFNETRSWDAPSGTTVPMRDKEVKQDYRFMPEPNLPPLWLNLGSKLSKELINVSSLKSSIPELPEETREKLKSVYGLSTILVLQLVSEEKLLKLFMEVVKVKSRDAKMTACLLTIDLMTLVNKDLISLDNLKINDIVIGDLVDLLQSGKINLNTAKKVMEEIALGNPRLPNEIVNDLGLSQITNIHELEALCNQVIIENPKIVMKYKSGKTKVFAALLGIVAKKTNNRAKMDVVTQILKKQLDN